MTVILVMSQALLSSVIGYVIKKGVYGLKEKQVTSQEAFKMGALTLASMYCSNCALRFVSYPT